MIEVRTPLHTLLRKYAVLCIEHTLEVGLPVKSDAAAYNTRNVARNVRRRVPATISR